MTKFILAAMLAFSFSVFADDHGANTTDTHAAETSAPAGDTHANKDAKKMAKKGMKDMKDMKKKDKKDAHAH